MRSRQTATWQWIFGPDPLMSVLGLPEPSTKLGPSWASAVCRLLYSYRDPRGQVRLRWQGALQPHLMVSLTKRMPPTTPEWMLQEHLAKKLSIGLFSGSIR